LVARATAPLLSCMSLAPGPLHSWTLLSLPFLSQGSLAGPHSTPQGLFVTSRCRGGGDRLAGHHANITLPTSLRGRGKGREQWDSLQSREQLVSPSASVQGPLSAGPATSLTQSLGLSITLEFSVAGRSLPALLLSALPLTLIRQHSLRELGTILQVKHYKAMLHLSKLLRRQMVQGAPGSECQAGFTLRSAWLPHLCIKMEKRSHSACH
jgi:hypothetical protein